MVTQSIGCRTHIPMHDHSGYYDSMWLHDSGPIKGGGVCKNDWIIFLIRLCGKLRFGALDLALKPKPSNLKYASLQTEQEG